MLKIPGRPPEKESFGYVGFGQAWIQLQRALAVKLSFLQPRPAGVELEVPGSAHEGENGMRQRKAGIARYRIHQMLAGFFQQGGIAGRAAPVALHELGISQRIFAVTRVTMYGRPAQRPVQGSGDAYGDVVLEVEQARRVEITCPRKTGTLQAGIQHLQCEPRLILRKLNRAVNQKTNAELRCSLSRRDARGKVQDRRGGKDIHILQIAETRDQGVRKTKAKTFVVRGLAA